MSEPLPGTQPDGGAVPLDEPAPAPQLQPVDPLGPYRRWATTLFTILVLVGIVAVVAVLAAMPSRVVFWVLVASVVLFIATLLVVIAAIRRRESWAVHAIAPICYVIVAAAVIRVVVALSQGTITMPLEGIGALMVLTRDHRPELLPTADGARGRVWLAAGVIVVSELLAYATGPVASGGPLGVPREALDLHVAIDCSAAGEPGGAIPVRASWSWREREVLSPPVDGLVVQWKMTESADAIPSTGGIVDDQMTLSHPAIWSGGGGLASTLIQPLMMRGFPYREFGIDVGKSGLIDGSVELSLRPADPTSRNGGLEVWAAYAHGDRWLRQSDTAACSW